MGRSKGLIERVEACIAATNAHLATNTKHETRNTKDETKKGNKKNGNKKTTKNGKNDKNTKTPKNTCSVPGSSSAHGVHNLAPLSPENVCFPHGEQLVFWYPLWNSPVWVEG